MNELVSIIIPIYNVQKYLKKCLDSVINQKYKNLEIILINDGSTDNSLDIAINYKNKDKRIKLFSQTNQGLSAARNTGLKNATGKYITFVDSDDYITPDYVSYMYDLLKRNNFKSSLAICSLMNIFEKSGKQVNMGNGLECTLSGKECIKKMCYQDLVDTCAYAKLGSRELYKNFSFPTGKVFEDIGTTYKLFEKCKTVECGFKPKYYYYIRSNSITTRKFDNSKLNLIEMTDKMAKDVIQFYPDLSKAVLRRQVYSRFSTLNQTLEAKKSSNIKRIQRNLIDYIKKNGKQIVSDPNVSKRDKLAYIILNIGYPIYKITWLSYVNFKK